ncbi:dde superfamily endonuclease [Holotrichia oblita]|uniref:Dde superfamily endonuclease n=1 Tax=Holotrichia oblita TaxID=644536 RepID=A0ACB9TN08_HOLOL|nr:dde superfamily endonuclease [Holotrichia oblita]
MCKQSLSINYEFQISYVGDQDLPTIPIQVFNNSTLRHEFQQQAHGNHILLGDSGYRNRNYLLTHAENLFNEAHIRTRNCVERLYGIWKRRFPVLAHGMRLQLRFFQCVIVATAVLHNIACDEKEEVPPVDADVMIDIVEDVPVQVNFYNVARDNTTRHHLITNYFNNL